MGDLGEAILNAMRDQGWLVLIDDEAVHAVGPTGVGAVIPLSLFTPEKEWKLRIILMNLVVTHGLWWPWPPDHHDDVRGETPRFDG